MIKNLRDTELSKFDTKSAEIQTLLNGDLLQNLNTWQE